MLVEFTLKFVILADSKVSVGGDSAVVIRGSLLSNFAEQAYKLAQQIKESCSSIGLYSSSFLKLGFGDKTG